MSSFGDAFLDDYFAECDEHLSAIRHALLALETAGAGGTLDTRVSEELFRAYHSLKGLAGMVEDRQAEALSHELESYLRALRDREAPLTATSIDALIDGTRALDQAIAAHQRREAPPDASAILGVLRGLTPNHDPRSASPSGPVSGLAVPAAGGTPWECVFTPSAELSARGVNVNTIRARLRARGEIRRATPAVMPDGTVLFRFLIDGPVDDEVVAEWAADGLIASPVAIASDAPLETVTAPLESATTTPARSAAHYVRVDLARLDDLMRMIGDMVIQRARLADAVARAEAHMPPAEWRAIQESAAGLERQLRDLRDGVMRVRLVPVGEIFRRMPFVVRDLARDSDRRVQVVLSGQDTQIDKFLVERMMDPVVHLVRNAVSHGLESVSDRVAAGKPPEGTIALSARAAGEVVTLEIADDGRGVDVARVLARAARVGLPVPQADQIDGAALLDLLCAPGFSTRDEADHTSGRGFGMAVVRTTVQELGGTLRLTSTPGEGTRFSIDLPLTLAITDALVAVVGDQTFAIPQSAVREVIDVDVQAIREIQGGEVMSFRGAALPIVRLSRALGVPSLGRPRRHALIVGTAAAAVGLLVDRVVSQREIVVRTTSDPLIRVDGVAGATDLGDGRAVLILDVAAVTRAARARTGGVRGESSRGIA